MRRTTVLATLIGAVLLLSGLLGGGPAMAQQAPSDEDRVTWAITPSPLADATKDEAERVSFRLELEPGTQHEDSVEVRNFSDRRVTFALLASDGVVSESGDFDVLPADQDPTNGGAWVDIAEKVTVPADESTVVPFTIRVPKDALPGDHPAGIVATVATDSDGADAVALDARVGARIHLRVAGELGPQLAVTDIETSYTGTVNPFAPGTLEITWQVENTGNVRLGADQLLDVAGLWNIGPGIVGDPIGAQREILPGQSTRGSATVEAWPLGRLSVDITAVPRIVGEDAIDVALPPATTSTTVTAVPWPHLALALLLALAIGLVIRRIVRARRRPATSKTPDAESESALVG